MTITEFVEKALEGGWDTGNYKNRIYRPELYMKHLANDCMHEILLDPLAWQAVGKVEGFKDEKYCASGAGCEWDNQSNHEFECVWKYSQPNPEHLAVGMITALFEGKTIESYLETL